MNFHISVCRLKRRINILKELETPQYLSKQIIDNCSNIILFKDPNHILFLFFEILRKYNALKSDIKNDSSSSTLNVDKTFVESKNNESKTTIFSDNDYYLDENNVNVNNNNNNSNSATFNSSNLLRGSKFGNSEEKIIQFKEERNKNSKYFCTCNESLCCSPPFNYFYRQLNEKYVCCCTQTCKYKMKKSGHYISKLLDNSILITKDQGVFQVHIVRLELTKTVSYIFHNLLHTLKRKAPKQQKINFRYYGRFS